MMGASNGGHHAKWLVESYYILAWDTSGAEYNDLIGSQLDALEQWIDYR